MRATMVPSRAKRRVVGRGGGIRTRDPLLPKQVLYQAELRPDGAKRPVLWNFRPGESSSHIAPKLRTVGGRSNGGAGFVYAGTTGCETNRNGAPQAGPDARAADCTEAGK